ncbi:CG7276, partial [Drosophila busckii]
PARDVTITNAYNIGPAFGCKFPVPHIRYMIDRVLYDKLRGKTYTAADAVKWVREVADDVNLKMKGYCVQPRYKHVVNVIIYQQNGAGCFYGARAIWDLLTDDYAMTTFNGNTFMCIVTVFGVYQY